MGDLAESATFARALHHATALTLAGAYEPFERIAAAVDPGIPDRLEAVEPYPDAREALELVRGAGSEAWVLTNGGRKSTEKLLERGGLRELVAEVRSVEEVEAYKPDPRTYALVPAGSTLVAAHGWDIAGALAAGLDAVWVDRDERSWPLPVPEPERRASTLPEAAELATRR